MFAKNYSKFYDVLNSDKKYKKEIEFIHKWADKPEKIIDIGCGTANYWKYFPQPTSVWGIEPSKFMREASPYRGRIFDLDATFIAELDFFKEPFDCATAIFNVINYMPQHEWWKDIPIKKGGYFIFDIYDKDKVVAEGFRETFKRVDNVSRRITPSGFDGNLVDLKIEVCNDGVTFFENHRLFLFSMEEIKKFCGEQFDIVDINHTKDWQTWVKLQKK